MWLPTSGQVSRSDVEARRTRSQAELFSCSETGSLIFLAVRAGPAQSVPETALSCCSQPLSLDGGLGSYAVHQDAKVNLDTLVRRRQENNLRLKRELEAGSSRCFSGEQPDSHIRKSLGRELSSTRVGRGGSWPFSRLDKP